ncbi:hypothetical protein [Shewanella colwelliana]|uniref:hypothetical protein n=1 Tax=Shewanella colwelliana TaxID=23 RepID=UPI0022AE6086|nr:hypothetical protein [Shewanella colwelliana]MCZ4339658.1 hypothetical protein [Shewanella colwelliana]
MGLPVTVYRHTDAGAPVIRPQKPSDWLAILKACLVDGYGDKSPLGWTLEFEDVASLKMVFKNNLADGGSGGAVQVESHDGTDGITSLVRFTAAGQITALDTYVEKCGYRVIGINTNTTFVGGWTVIGCGRAFYVRQEIGIPTWNQTSSGYYNYTPQYWIGDIESFIPNDQHIFTMVSGNYARQPSDDSTVVNYYASQLGGSSQGAAAQLYAPDGSGVSVDYLWGNYLDGGNMSSGYSLDPSAMNVPLAMIPAILRHSGLSNTVNPAYRGTIPGLFVINFPAFWDQSIPINKNFGGVDYEIGYGRSKASYVVQSSGEWYA